VARQGNPTGENPGIGRVSPGVREIARSRRIVDSVYDPKSYHNSLPPAAWAHGPHQDSWAGHSEDGVNIWWAMCDTPAEAGMVLYPELAGKELPREPRTLYLKAGYALPKPTMLPLAAGEMLIFDPEILHGTHLNVSPRTRVAVSLRLNARQPRFSPDCFYAREFWRRASDIEQGRFDAVLHLKREENFGASRPPRAVEWPEPLRTIHVDYAEDGAPIRLGLSSSIEENERILVQLPDRRVLVHRVDGVLAAVDARCPHYGIDLSDGAAERELVFCPGCGVAFNLFTGASSAPSLTLERIPVQEDDAGILLLLRPSRQTKASASG
jgi:nitrite reductase/ring-hydroxylating ferredoxin subunit